MNILQSLFLGIIQGLTEFLPISSSGHLVLGKHFLGLQSGGDLSFEIMLHFGSLLAVLIYFRKDIIDLIISLFHWGGSSPKHTSNHWVLLYLMIATAITGVIGLMFSDFFEAQFSKPILVAGFLSITGALLFLSDYVKSSDRQMSNIGYFRAIIIGLGQAVAILPGISRSGTTISVSLFTGMKREEAARFSFLLSIPAILGANVKELGTITQMSAHTLGISLAGTVAAFVSGYLVISVLLRIIKQKKLRYFAFYCWLVSVVSIILILKGF